MWTNMVETIKRTCSVCGKSIFVEINPKTGAYSGGHYFGKIGTKLVGSGKTMGKIKIAGKNVPVVDIRLGGKKIEYWECPNCLNE